jgi:hypothetical protein
MSRFLHFVLFAGATVAAVGCGASVDKSKAGRPSTVTAKGSVTYNSKPLEGAIIVLSPKQAGGLAASGVSDAEGNFDLQAFPPDPGAVPGDYSVIITKMSTPPQQTNLEGGDGSNSGPPAVSLIPKKYSRPDQSKLSANIPAAGTDSLKFELKD